MQRARLCVIPRIAVVGLQRAWVDRLREPADNAKFAVVEKVKAHFRALYDTIELDGARVNFPHGWGLVRASNTQPVLVTRFEADSAEALAAIREEMETPLKKWIEEAE